MAVGALLAQILEVKRVIEHLRPVSNLPSEQIRVTAQARAWRLLLARVMAIRTAFAAEPHHLLRRLLFVRTMTGRTLEARIQVRLMEKVHAGEASRLNLNTSMAAEARAFEWWLGPTLGHRGKA